MTCIVGIETKDGILMGGDSAGVAGTHLDDRSDTKVAANGPFVIGFSGSYRVGQILKYLWHPPTQAIGVEDEAFMVREVVGTLRKTFADHGVRGTSGTADAHDGPFLLGYRGKIYKIETDFQVARNRDGYNACGCGYRVALGAIYAVRAYPEIPGFGNERYLVQKALEAAEHFDSAVKRPFTFMHGPWTPPTPVQIEVKL